jgi:pyrrolysyl-tRNA synthetase-like protein
VGLSDSSPETIKNDEVNKLSEKTRKSSCWKRTPLFQLLEKIKLWPSRQGVLHGIKIFEVRGESYAYIVTHCGEQILIRNSKNSRAARWLRNKWYVRTCEKCAIPEWKVKKYSLTVFKSGRVPVFLERQKDKIKIDNVVF